MAEAPPSERVFVSGLPEGLQPAQLQSIFGAYGTLKEVKSLPQSKACVLVFASLDEAKWVVENLDGNMPEGISQCLNVKFATQAGGWQGGGWTKGGGWQATSRPGPYSGGKGAGGGKGGGQGGGKGGSIMQLKRQLHSSGVLPGSKGTQPQENQLYIRGLPSDTTDGDLAEIFAPFGAIPPKGVKAMMNEDGTCRGVGFVDFMSPECAQAATNALNGTALPDGSALGVYIKNSTKGSGKGGGKDGA